jgi:hypothetical protein
VLEEPEKGTSAADLDVVGMCADGEDPERTVWES